MPTDPASYHLARAAARRHGPSLLKRPGVHGVGVGHKTVGGENTGVPCVVVFVEHELPAALVERIAIPDFLAVEGTRVPTDMRRGGPFRPQRNVARIRPARPGTSIGQVRIMAGTFGGIVVDGGAQRLILSNNHVLANSNAAPIGSPIVQPGPIDGGDAPADTIATLFNFIVLSNAVPNLVDAAVALPLSEDLISNVPLNGVPPPTPATPAVGLIFGGDCVAWTVLNPIQTVLTTLGVSLPEPAAVTPAAIGMQLQKTGRTTERTMGEVQVLGMMLPIDYRPPLGVLTFTDQICASMMSLKGDSGSIAVVV